MSSFEVGQQVIVENGNFRRQGPVLAVLNYETVVVEIIGNKLECNIEHVRLAPMSAERPWEHFNREELEGALAQQAAQIAKLQTEATGMAEVLAMQMEAVAKNAAAALEHPKMSHGHVRYVDGPNDVLMTDNGDWYELLVDLLELYLVRQLGQRHPVAIADPDLRALVSHILD